MSIWGPLSRQEYDVCMRILEQLKASEAELETPEALQLVGDMRAKLQAAIDQYQTAHKEDR